MAIIKKCIFLILFLTLIVTVWLNYASGKGENMRKTDLTVELSLDKNIYKLGDKIEITYAIRNKGKKNIKILPWRLEYASDVIKIFDAHKEKDMKALSLLIFELKFIPSIKDFVVLKQNDSFKKVFIGNINEETLREWSSLSSREPLETTGIFINFKDSAILLENGYDEYVVKGVYKTDKDAIEKGRKLYNLADTWEGEIKSDEVRFVLQR